MDQTPLDATQLAKLHKMASKISKLAWPGIIGVILSFFEGSPA